jgi:hypothetical protein
MEEEKRDHEAKMKKMETEMEQVFEMKVREKKQKLKDSELDVSWIYVFSSGKSWVRIEKVALSWNVKIALQGLTLIQ